MAIKVVLIIDDSEQARLIVRTVFEKHGYVAITSESGRNAVDMLRCGLKVDLVVLDVKMPGMDGFDTLTYIRRLGLKDLPVIMLTGKVSDTDIWDGYEAGADCYLTKPCSEDDLIQASSAMLSYDDGES